MSENEKGPPELDVPLHEMVEISSYEMALAAQYQRGAQLRRWGIQAMTDNQQGIEPSNKEGIK